MGTCPTEWCQRYGRWWILNALAPWMKMVSWCVPKPYTPTKPQARNPKLGTKLYTQKTGLYRGAAAAEEREQEQKKKQDFIAVRLLLKKKREDLDAYLEMLDTQVSRCVLFATKEHTF